MEGRDIAKIKQIISILMDSPLYLTMPLLTRRNEIMRMYDVYGNMGAFV